MTVHHEHDHGLRGAQEANRLLIALLLIASLMAAEVVVGILASSLALLSDAAHMLTDAGALGLALIAARLARQPPRGPMTFGLGRAEALSAQANGITLLILAAFVIYEAVRRLVSPAHPQAVPMLVVALVGAVVNLLAIRALAPEESHSINVEGSIQHVLTDLYAFAATALAAVVILASHFERADAIASLLVAALMLRSGTKLLLASARVFLEAAPAGLDPQQIGELLARQPGVVEVHDLHVWEVTTGFPALSAHVLVASGEDCHGIRRELERVLGKRYELRHTTLQVDHAPADRLLAIETRAAPPRS